MKTPEGWRETSLGRIAQESKTRIVPSPGDIRPYVGLEHIIPGSPSIESTGDTSEVTSQKTVFNSGDTLFGKLRPYLRKVALAEFEGVCSTDILAIRPTEHITDRFLNCFLASERAIAHAIDTSAGTKMPRTSWKQMAQLPILLPSLPEQKQIAEVLGSVDEAIRATKALIEQTRRVKQGLLQQLLTRGIGHTRFKMTEIGEIPESWEVVRLGDVAKVNYGLTVNQTRRASTRRAPYLTVANHSGDGFVLDTVKDIGVVEGDESRYSVLPGDILLVEGNGNPNILGSPAMWMGQLPFVLHQNHLIRVRLTDRRLSPAWVLHVLRGPMSRRYILAEAKTSSGLHTINSAVVKNLPIVVPPDPERRQTLSLLENVDRYITKAESNDRALVCLKTGLMQELLSGQVRVAV